jgi:hypothetical protein
MQEIVFQNNMKIVAEKLKHMLCGEALCNLYPVITETCHVYALKHLAHLSGEHKRLGKLALGIAAPKLVMQTHAKLTKNIELYLNSLPTELHLHTNFNLDVLAATMATEKFATAKRKLNTTPESNQEQKRDEDSEEESPFKLTPEQNSILELFKQKHGEHVDHIQREYMHHGKMEGLDFIHLFAKTLMRMGITHPVNNICCLDSSRTYSKFATQHRSILHPEWYYFMAPIMRKEYKINFTFHEGVGTCLQNARI